jgi:hypothetical protein
MRPKKFGDTQNLPRRQGSCSARLHPFRFVDEPAGHAAAITAARAASLVTKSPDQAGFCYELCRFVRAP